MKRLKQWPWTDFLTISGALAIAGGVAWFSPAAGVIVLGIQVVVIGVALDVARNRMAEHKRRGP